MPCRRRRSPALFPESVPASPAPHRVLPFHWPRTPRCLRSDRCGSPPEDSRCNLASLLCPCLCVPSSHPGPFSIGAFGSTASHRESLLSHCQDRPAEPVACLPFAENSSDSPMLPAVFHPP